MVLELNFASKIGFEMEVRSHVIISVKEPTLVNV